ncbi:MAG: cadherin-like beta sandwich domain-containing protein [Nitrospira sp.]|nr:cadherin-like beta sandwich domain-containing protein [Nitrospira sp.]
MMIRTMTVMRQYLVAVFLIAIGLVASGCGDTASVNPAAQLASLAVDPGSLEPAFSGGTTQYKVNLSTSITSVTITAQPTEGGDTVTINNQPTTNSVITLGAAGTTTTVSISVSGSGEEPRTYVVSLVRAGLNGNNSLENLAVSPGTLTPTFEENFLSYTVDVANTVGSVTVTPTLSDTAATMTVNGQLATSGQASIVPLNAAGQDTAIPIVVTAQNSNAKRYTVTVSRGVSSNNNLQSLAISPGTLTPTFNANRASTSYTVNVASTVTSVTVTPRLQDATARMTVNGQATNSGQARTIQLGAPGSTPPPIFIVVTAQNGTQKTYTVGVNRAALGGNNNLSSLTVSQGTLEPNFNTNRTSYTVDVGSTVASITVTPRLQDTTASMTVNGQATNSGQSRTVPLNGAGSNTIINIIVTAPNGTQMTYTVNVSRAALGGNNNLSGLTVRVGTAAQALSPTFAPSTTTYTANVGSTVTSVTVTATLQDTDASMTIEGQGTSSGQGRSITLGAAGTSAGIDILVTAQNGSQKPYRVTVNKALPSSDNDLSALSVRMGTAVQPLSPPFASSTTTYTANAAANVTQVIVAATKDDPNAVMAIGGVTVPAGTASGQATVPLNGAGTNTDVSITVTAQNGSPQPYAVTINRAAPSAPPAPASAPNLIPADDSGFLPGNDSDNVTNVTTPRFQIPPPGAGEAPNLYVDGAKVGSTFDQGANTLQPTTPLSGSDLGTPYSITSTVTNTATNLESNQSAALTVTINTGAPAPP